MCKLLLFLFYFSDEQDDLDFKKLNQEKKFDLCKIRADEAEKNLLEMTKRANELSQKLERSEKDLNFHKLRAEERANLIKVMELKQTTITNLSESGIYL